MEKLLKKNDTFRIIGMCMEIHRLLGFGFSEIVYKDALEIEASLSEAPVCREKEYVIPYKGKRLRHKYFADFIMFDNIIVEIKATNNGISSDHISQTLNYMKAADCKVGLIINFGKRSLEHKRLVF